MPLQIEAKPAPESELVESRQAKMQRTSSANYCTRRRCLSISVATFSARTENLAVILMAAKFGLPVCPHAGGVGLCEYVQLSMSTTSPFQLRWKTGLPSMSITFMSISSIPSSFAMRATMPPRRPGYSIEIKPDSRTAHQFPKWLGLGSYCLIEKEDSWIVGSSLALLEPDWRPAR